MAPSRAAKPPAKPKANPKPILDEHEAEPESDLEPYSDELDVSSPDVLDTATDDGQIEESDDDDDESDELEDKYEEVEGSNDDVKKKLAHVSFGALAKAHHSLSGEGRGRKRKRGQDDNEEAEGKLKALRERLRELRGAKGVFDTASAKKDKARKADATSQRKSRDSKGSFFERAHSDGEEGEEAQSDSNISSGSASDEDEEPSKKKLPSRGSKHAPTVMSSKRTVTRRRTIIHVAKPALGDPRFERFTGRLNTAAVDQRYSFLDQYRADELAELKKALKKQGKTLDEQSRENLKRKILSYESKQKTRQDKDRERKVVKEHRSKEKEAGRQGKKSFYLKKSEVKKQALVDKFEGMKAKEKERAIQRRRKKLASREKRSMPRDRRM
jgi:ribosomal RNA-processing protein 36